MNVCDYENWKDSANKINNIVLIETNINTTFHSVAKKNYK